MTDETGGGSPRRPRKKPQASTHGKFNPIADQSNWRVKLRAQSIKFDDEQKETYLVAISEHGRRTDAARSANVCPQTVANHLKNDPDFARAFDNAIGEYRDKVRGVAQKLALEGVEEPIIGGQFKDTVVATKLVYATNILAMEMRRTDPEYRDKQTEAVTDEAQGVLVAPAEVDSLEAWAAQYAPKVDEAVAEDA